jgi:hypothetical protein
MRRWNEDGRRRRGRKGIRKAEGGERGGEWGEGGGMRRRRDKDYCITASGS